MYGYINLILVFGFLGTLNACSTPLPSYEVEWRRSIDHENWRMCANAYKQYNHYTIHVDHTIKEHKYNSRWVKYDLLQNNCRQVLGQYWADY
jgi:hypothetical protein